jgi:hypothetical protein
MAAAQVWNYRGWLQPAATQPQHTRLSTRYQHPGKRDGGAFWGPRYRKVVLSQSQSFNHFGLAQKGIMD